MQAEVSQRLQDFSDRTEIRFAEHLGQLRELFMISESQDAKLNKEKQDRIEQMKQNMEGILKNFSKIDSKMHMQQV